MPLQASLFDDDTSVPGNDADARAGAPAGSNIVLSALKVGGGKPSAEQHKFNRLLERTESLAARIAAAQALVDGHRQRASTVLHPLEKKHLALMREMALWLDGRLAQSGLTRTQQRIATEILCGLAAALAAGGDGAMRDLHDAHAARSLDDEQQATAAATRSLLEELLGRKLDIGDDDADPEAMMRAGLEQLEAQAQAQEQAREAARAGRRSARARATGRKQVLPPAEDADRTLRTIYRQLASALHPDRESDPHAHRRKTALMSEANAAYGRRDLLALLKLQVQADLADGLGLAALARDRLASLSLLLKERADWLAGELRALEQAAREEFALPPNLPLSEAALRRHLRDCRESLQYDIGSMQRDLRLVRDDAQFKRWLREQERLGRQ